MPPLAMTPTAHFNCCASTGFLPGSRPCLPNLRDEQESRYLVCQAWGGSGCCRTSSIVSLLNKNRKISHVNRHLFVTIVEHCSISQRWQDRRTEVRVAADYPDSKPDASSIFGDLGYHPLEDIPSFEKKKHIEQVDRRLTDAEVARTLAEVNQSAIIYAPVEQDVDHVLGTEVQYIIDEHGDFYFQIDDDSEFLSTLNNAQYLNVAIGYKNIGDWMLEHEVHDDNAQDDSEESDDSNSHDEEEEEEGETWVVVAAEDAEFVLEAVDDGPSESIGDWSGLDTLQFVHPLDFAGALAEAAVANYQEKIEKPSKTLKMVGELCHLNDDEEAYVQRLFHDKFRDEDEDDEETEEEVKHDDDDTDADGSDDVVLLAKDTTGSSKGGKDDRITEAPEYSDGTTTFYKLEIQQIHVVSGLGAQISVDKTEFQSAKPDILAQFSTVIIERLNSCGKSLEDTLKALCLQKKGLEVEEVVLLEIDSLGMDLRVHCGREVQTIRIPFNQRATSVEHAEQLLNQLLNPRIQHRARRKRRPWSQGKAS